MAKQKSINDKLTEISSGLTVTPAHIAEEMIELIPDRIWNRPDLENVRFLDICAKSGAFPAAIRKKLLTLKHFVAKYDNEDDLELAIENMLYCIAPTKQCAELVRRKLYVDYKYKGNVVVLGKDYKEFEAWFKLDYKPNKGTTLKQHLDKQLKLRKEHIEKIFSDMEGNKVTFDVVVGNPPYNSDIYLDFVTLGHKMSQDCSCMITPAKWQAKGGQKNEDFRKDIVPYMEKIVFYPEAKEVFDIGEWDGITYFNIDKNKIHNTKSIQNICKSNNVLDSFMEQTDEVSVTLYRKSIRDILRKIDYSKNMSNKCRVIYSEFVGNTYWGNKDKRTENDLELYQGEKHIGYVPRSELRTAVNVDKYKVITSVMAGAGIYSMDKKGKALGSNKLNKLRPNQVPKGSYTCLAFFDSSEECDSYMSYFETKLVSFLVYIGVCGTSFAEEFWRFIPDPGKFDHIFTDEELYTKYNLTEEEINIIESVIKERK